MKIKLSCYYSPHNPGDVIDVDAKEGARLLGVGAGVEVKDEKPAAPAPAETPAPAKSGKGK